MQSHAVDEVSGSLLRTIFDLTQAVAAASEPEEIYEAALTCLTESLGVSRCAVLLFETDGVMRFKASRGLSVGYRAAVEGHSPWTYGTSHAAPVLVADVRCESSLDHLQGVIEAEGIRALAFVPLALGPRLIGKFMLYYDRPHQFTPAEVLIAQNIAAQVAFGIDHYEHRESEQRYRRLIDALGVAMYVTDEHGRVVRYNQAAAAFWGRRPAIGEEMWCGSWRLRHPDGQPMPHDECPMAIAIRERRPVRGEGLADRPDGTTIPFISFPTPLFDTSGRLSGAVNVLIDITDRKVAEQQLTEALAAKDEFLSLVSHELRTPLTTIRGNAEVLARKGDALSALDRDAAIDDLVTESERLQNIIDNLLLLARAERGQLAEREPLLVVRVLEQVVARHRRRFPNRRITITQESAPRPVSFAPGYLELVIENLLSNAEKYSPADTSIIMDVERTATDVIVRVIDEGSGIDEAVADRLFEPFFRAAKAIVRASGMGIGLAVCRRLVESQGGRIWARNRPGFGAEFGFSLPIIEEPSDVKE